MALSRSYLAMRAANRIFISTFAAMVCSLPFGSTSFTTGLATFEPMNGVLTLLNEETFTLASSQYAPTHHLRKSDMSYSTMLTSLVIQPTGLSHIASGPLSFEALTSFLAAVLSLIHPGFEGNAHCKAAS